MTIDLVNALYRYFSALYKLNQNIIVLCGIDAIDNRKLADDYIDNVIQDIPRLIPYKWRKKEERLLIDPKSGLLAFSNEIPFLESDFINILDVHYIFLDKIRKVRNKLEHEMHVAKITACSSGSTSLFSITYELNGEENTLSASEIIEFVKCLNITFHKIQDLVEKFSSTNRQEHPYYYRLIRYSFTEFNNIYSSDILRTFGKALLPF